jgi:hypothetical protein
MFYQNAFWVACYVIFRKITRLTAPLGELVLIVWFWTIEEEKMVHIHLIILG